MHPVCTDSGSGSSSLGSGYTEVTSWACRNSQILSGEAPGGTTVNKFQISSWVATSDTICDSIQFYLYSASYSNTNETPNIRQPLYKQAPGDSGKEKLLFNREKTSGRTRECSHLLWAVGGDGVKSGLKTHLFEFANSCFHNSKTNDIVSIRLHP